MIRSNAYMEGPNTKGLFFLRELPDSWRQKKNGRQVLLDFFRGGMLLCMILNHCATYFWLAPEPNYYIQSLRWLNYFIAANFLMISGFVHNYYIHSRKIRMTKKSLFFRETVCRALFIYGISTLISVIFGSLGGLDDSWSHWSIFKIIGISMIIISLFDSFKHSELLLVVVMAVFSLLGYLSTMLDSNLLDFFSKGTFAFFPWFNFFSAGFILGKYLIIANRASFDLFRLKKILIPSLALIVLFAFPLMRYDVGAYIELNLRLLLGNIGLFLWFLAASYYITEKTTQPLIRWLIEQVAEFGKISFSLYYIHFALIFVVLLINTNMFTGSLFLRMNGWIFTEIVALLFAVLAMGNLVWKKLNYVLSLEWFIYNSLQLALRK